VDLAVQAVTPMDKHGYFNFGPLNNFKKAVFEKAKIKVVEVIQDMPWCLGGYDECIHLSDVDYVIENTKDKMITIPPGGLGNGRTIAAHIAELIPKDGALPQIGIAAFPTRCFRFWRTAAPRTSGSTRRW
jgi:acyl-CoA hydrolase